MNSPMFRLQYQDFKLDNNKEREWYVVYFDNFKMPNKMIFPNYSIEYGIFIESDNAEIIKQYEDSLPVVMNPKNT